MIWTQINCWKWMKGITTETFLKTFWPNKMNQCLLVKKCPHSGRINWFLCIRNTQFALLSQIALHKHHDGGCTCTTRSWFSAVIRLFAVTGSLQVFIPKIVLARKWFFFSATVWRKTESLILFSLKQVCKYILIMWCYRMLILLKRDTTRNLFSY